MEKHTEGKLKYDPKFPGAIWTENDVWIASTNVESILMEKREPNARRLCLCWNLHNDLIDALKEFVLRAAINPEVREQAQRLIDLAEGKDGEGGNG